MGFNCGIVGLPNVGKSTLFNAITSTAAAAAANYPFCTIEPNLGRVPVPDPRLDAVARIARSAQVVPTQLEIVDIAGPGARRQPRRGPRQPLPRRDPRGRRDPARAALLRERRRRPCRGQRRSGARCRAGRDRAAAGRPRRARAPDRRPDQARPRRRQGRPEPARADRADPAGARRPARRPAGSRSPADAARDLRGAPAADREAAALRLQRRGERGRERQRAERAVASYAAAQGAGMVVVRGGDRGRARRPRRPRSARVSGGARPRANRA